MVIAVRTVPGDEGLEIVKEADSDEDRLRLSHEADMLRRAAHPGVVEVVDHGANTLRLRHRGTPLAHLLPLPADNAAAVVCAVAEIVEAMHDVGVAHGCINADHVLLDDRGRPRLCGFGHAEPIVTPRSGAAADDAAALGDLLNELLDAAAGHPWSPALEGSRARTRRKKARQAFREAAAMASRADAPQRITPRQLSSALRAALPRLELPTPPLADTDATRRRDGSAPQDASPTESPLWSEDELSFLKTDGGDRDLRLAATGSPHGPYAVLADLDNTAPADADDPDARAEVPGQLPLLDDRDAPAAGLGPDVGDTAFATTATAVVDSGTASEQAAASGPAALAPVKLREPAVPAKSTRPPRPVMTYLLIAIALLALGSAVGILVTQILPGADDGNDSAVSTGPGDTGPADTGDPGTSADDATSPGPANPQPSGPGSDSWPPECALPAITGPDLNDDGCPSAISLDGRLATVGDIEISLGSAGDLVVVADANCDGIATPFLLRPSSGEVFAFPEWAIDHPVEVTTMTVIAGAVSITSTPNVDGCGDVVAIQVSGQGSDVIVARDDS